MFGFVQKHVASFIKKMELCKVNIHGCSLGLVSKKKGEPIKKPWTIATDNFDIWMDFQTKICPGPDVHPVHAHCSGQDTKLTENYTDEMVDVIHRAWKKYIAKGEGQRPTVDGAPAEEKVFECKLLNPEAVAEAERKEEEIRDKIVSDAAVNEPNETKGGST